MLSKDTFEIYLANYDGNNKLLLNVTGESQFGKPWNGKIKEESHLYSYGSLFTKLNVNIYFCDTN